MSQISRIHTVDTVEIFKVVQSMENLYSNVCHQNKCNLKRLLKIITGWYEKKKSWAIKALRFSLLRSVYLPCIKRYSGNMKNFNVVFRQTFSHIYHSSFHSLKSDKTTVLWQWQLLLGHVNNFDRVTYLYNHSNWYGLISKKVRFTLSSMSWMLKWECTTEAKPIYNPFLMRKHA